MRFLCIGKTVKICSSLLSESEFPKLLHFTNICKFCIIATALDIVYVYKYLLLVQWRSLEGQLERSRLAQHSFEQTHRVLRKESNILGTEKNSVYRKHTETAHLQNPIIRNSTD